MNQFDSNLNEQSLYQSKQIEGAIVYLNHLLDQDSNDIPLVVCEKLTSIFENIDSKLYSFYGLNLVQPNLLTYFYKYINLSVRNQLYEETDLKIVKSIASLLWNATDCHETFCEALINYKNMKKLLRETLLHNLNPAAYSSIIHNILRRPKLRKTYYDDEEMLLKFKENFKNFKDFSMKIVCLMSSMEIIPASRYGELESLAEEIQATIIVYLFECLDSKGYRAQGFEISELLDVILNICRIKTIKMKYCENKTLQTSLTQLLIRNHLVEIVLNIIDSLYDSTTKASIKETYLAKCDKPAEYILQRLHLQ